MTAEALAEIRQIAADVLGVPVESVTADSSPETLEGWDSLKHINIMMAIEQAFGVEILPEEMDEIRTVGDAVRLVGAKRG
jgi:acyl carrier protein